MPQLPQPGVGLCWAKRAGTFHSLLDSAAGNYHNIVSQSSSLPSCHTNNNTQTNSVQQNAATNQANSERCAPQRPFLMCANLTGTLELGLWVWPLVLDFGSGYWYWNLLCNCLNCLVHIYTGQQQKIDIKTKLSIKMYFPLASKDLPKHVYFFLFDTLVQGIIILSRIV